MGGSLKAANVDNELVSLPCDICNDPVKMTLRKLRHWKEDERLNGRRPVYCSMDCLNEGRRRLGVLVTPTLAELKAQEENDDDLEDQLPEQPDRLALLAHLERLDQGGYGNLDSLDFSI